MRSVITRAEVNSARSKMGGKAPHTPHYGILTLALLAGTVAFAADKPAPKIATPAPATKEAALDPLLLKALKARSIGPATMGGRVAEIALDPVNPDIFYVGLGTGGLMKTSDGGVTFKGVFDDQPVAAIGAVAVAPSDPKVVWVGTGEANDRNSSSWGNGVYRSTDGGSTWTHVGLEQSRAIARIVVHPTDPGTAWVAATGNLWQAGGERGLYKTTDGGATWKAVLTAAGDKGFTGAGDVVLDPKNPSVLYAALYARQRTPWSFTSGPALAGSDTGGIFKSQDGGATWQKLAGGLPTGTGRIGLAVYAKDPSIVYAVVQSDEAGTGSIDDVESKRGGVFRSADGGATWTRQSKLDPRPFYFSQIRVDPQDEKNVYVLGFMLHVSGDSGRTWREDRFGGVHSDNHALAIDPARPKHLLLGTDGGLYRSVDAGDTWEHLARMAAGEFYRINVDASTPYRICGGLQDNESWVGPVRTLSSDGIGNTDWQPIGGGDGFYCAFDAEDSQIVYAESQEGFIHRIDLRTGQIKRMRPEPAEGSTGFRFHWNSPIVASVHDKGTVYLAGNRVFALTQKGEEWKVISPDLSARQYERQGTVGSGAENYGVIYTLAESPVKAGVLWAGTDDGKVWMTEDAGAHWTDLTGNLPAAAKDMWVSRVEASPHDVKAAYLAIDGHRTGHLAPLAYRTGDGGRTWQSIAGDLPADGPVKVVREDPFNAQLLYAGTEFGLFASLDAGAHWSKIGKLPTVAVDDILVHPRERDLVVATHGRSLYVIDDVRPLQELTAETRAHELQLFPPRAATALPLLPGWKDSAGEGSFHADNPPAALITYWLPRYSGETVKVAITRVGSDVPVANLDGTDVPGLNRVTWDLKPTKDVLTQYGGEGAKFVPAGDYEVTVTSGKQKSKQTLHVDVPPGVETR